jgi:hypothetical protein
MLPAGWICVHSLLSLLVLRQRSGDVHDACAHSSGLHLVLRLWNALVSEWLRPHRPLR